jgi:hypothetical protein
MKKFLLTLILTMTTALAVIAGTQGAYNVEFHGVTTLSNTESSPVWIYNASPSNVAYVAFGGHAVAATNDPATYHANRMPIRPGASYTTAGSFSFVSVYCLTNGIVDIAFEGAP